MVTISLINQKGGCGKSSTCFHLSGALSARGYRVLLIDADPQGSLSQGFFGSVAIERLAAGETLATVFDTDAVTPTAESLVINTPVENVSIIPANQHLAHWNMPRPAETGMQQFVLATLLEELSSAYDFVLIDCPPNLYQCSWNAMIASGHCVIPVPPEDFGTQGLRAVHQAIDNARTLNPRLRRLGHIVTRYDSRLLIHQAYERQLRHNYADLMLDTLVPEASAFKVALSSRLPVEFTEPGSKAAVTTRRLCDELLARIALKRERRRAA